jgi:hypothetical protein
MASFGFARTSSAEVIHLTFVQLPSLLDYVTSYTSTGAGPTGGAVDFDANNGTAYAFNPALIGVNIDGTFSITYTSTSVSDNWLGARHNEGFLAPGLTAGPLTLGTLTVSAPLGPAAALPIGNDPTQDLHRLGETGFGDSYTYTVIPIPEPTTIVLLGAGLAGLAFLRRRPA